MLRNVRETSIGVNYSCACVCMRDGGGGCCHKLMNRCCQTSVTLLLLFFKTLAEKKHLWSFQFPPLWKWHVVNVPHPQPMTGIALMSQFLLLTVCIVIKMTCLPTF